MTNSLKKEIDIIIEETFNEIDAIYNLHREGCWGTSFYDDKDGFQHRSPATPSSRLIFPRLFEKREIDDIKTRISEQELRFVFVENLNKHIQDGFDVYYSVETPTRHKYNFKDTDNPECNNKKGVSARIDLTIHNNEGKRICLIEFKANNVDKSDLVKDLVKLNTEGSDPDCLLYFVHLLEVNQQGKAPSSDTIWNLEDKITDKLTGSHINYACHSLLTKQMKNNRKERRPGRDTVRNYIIGELPDNTVSNFPDYREPSLKEDPSIKKGLVQLKY